MKKKILLTGVTGFLGSHLLAGLREKYDVVGLKRSSSDVRRLGELLPATVLYDADRIHLETIFKEHRISGVVHAAASYGRDSNAGEVISANVLLPVNLMRLAQCYQASFFINTDSFFNKEGSCYTYLPEYTLSKRHCVDWLKFFSRGMFKGINLKLAHIYGPDDSPEKLVPSMLKRLSAHEPRIDLSPGDQRRDFTYVDDVVKTYDLVISQAEKMDTPFTEFEVGTGQSTSVKDFLTVFRSVISSKSTLNFGALPYRENEIMDHKADISGLRECLGWAPSMSIRQGLEKLIQLERSAHEAK